MRYRRLSIGLATAGLLSMILSGCTSDKPANEPDTTDAVETSSEGDDTAAEAGTGTDTASQTGTSSKSSPMDDMVGNWVYIGTNFHTDYDDGDTYDSTTMCTEEYSPESAVIVRKEGDKYIADYKMSMYESEVRIYGSELKYREEAASGNCLNQDWCVELADPFKDMDSVVRKLTVFDDMLIEAEEYTYHSEPDEEPYGYTSVTTNYYLQEGSGKLNDPDNLGYFDTVTVADATELLNSIQNNRKIILEAGTYNLSAVPQSKIDNPAIGEGYSAPSINGVSYLSIEAKDGADVLICVDDPYDPVMWFSNSGHIDLNGLTVGHDVEPGYCSGSVLYFDNVSGVSIDGCNLYGSGTYGIEASYTYDMAVTDTDIYECTYGLLDMRYVGTTSFKNCAFRDSSDMDMINLYNAYDVLFEDCEFKDNRCDWEGCDFVSMNEYSNATFRNCTFSNNTYDEFSEHEVVLEDCTIDGKPATFANMAKISSVSDIHDMYDRTLARQREIENLIVSDSPDQMTLNQYAFEEYQMWDSLLNGIWGYMSENLDEAQMDEIRQDQKAWIKDKEASMKSEGANFEGGSMQPMLEYGTGARLTKERVELLINRFFGPTE